MGCLWWQELLLSGGFICLPCHEHGVGILYCYCNMGRVGQTANQHQKNPCVFSELWTPFMGWSGWLGGTPEAQKWKPDSCSSKFQWIASRAIVITSRSSWATLGGVATKSITPWHHKAICLSTGCTHLQLFHFPCHGVAAIGASLEFLTLGMSLYILFYSWGIGWNTCLVCAS